MLTVEFEVSIDTSVRGQEDITEAIDQFSELFLILETVSHPDGVVIVRGFEFDASFKGVACRDQRNVLIVEGAIGVGRVLDCVVDPASDRFGHLGLSKHVPEQQFMNELIARGGILEFLELGDDAGLHLFWGVA